MPNYLTFPPNLRHSIRRYIEEGIPPGSFLTSVICNDLLGAFSNADEMNSYGMFSIVKWMYNQAPRTCWGSKEKMLQWMKARKEQKRKNQAEQDRPILSSKGGEV